MKTPQKSAPADRVPTEHPGASTTRVEVAQRVMRNKQRIRDWRRAQIDPSAETRVLGAMSVASFIDLLEEIGA